MNEELDKAAVASQIHALVQTAHHDRLILYLLPFFNSDVYVLNRGR